MDPALKNGAGTNGIFRPDRRALLIKSELFQSCIHVGFGSVTMLPKSKCSLQRIVRCREMDMSGFDPEKLLAEFEFEQAQLNAELEKLGLGSIDDLEETAKLQGDPDIVRVSCEISDENLVAELEQLIANGVDVNAASQYGATALSICFSRIV